MLLAAIDIGSNAVRLLFSNVFERNGFPVADKASLVRIPIRLGEDVFQCGSILENRAEKLIKTLSAFKLLIDVYEPVRYVACATAAMREAANSTDIVNRIRSEAGLEVRIIDGIEEARIVSAVNNYHIGKQFRYKMYVDVGGGSTEISISRNGDFIRSESFKIGTIRLREKLVGDAEWSQMKNWLKPLKDEGQKVYCIGSGGNINKIAKLFAKSDAGVVLLNELELANQQLSQVSLEYRITQMGMRPDRADVIVPATEIFLKIMRWANVDYIAVPKVGLPDGLVHLLYNDVMHGISNLK